MTTNVALSGAMRSNLLSLTNTQREIDTVQGRLATGRKVNSALDNPRNFFAAQSLNNRAGDLNRLLDSMGQSISTIKEADNGVSSLSKLLEQADSLAIQAKEELTNAQGQAVVSGTKDIADETNLVDLAGIDDGDTFTISIGGTSSGNIVIDDGDSAEMLVAKINNSGLEGKVEASLDESGQLQIKSLVDDASVRIVAGSGADADTFSALGLGNLTASESTAGTNGGTIVAGNSLVSRETSADEASDLMLGNFVDLDAGAPDETATISLTVDGNTSADITVSRTSTIQEFIDDINNDANLNGSLTASFNTDTGQLEIAANGSVSSIDFSVTANDGDIDTMFGFGSGALDDSNTISSGEVGSEFFTLGGGSADVARLEADFNEIRNQIDALVADASYRGVNLLAGDNMETVFNESRSNKLTTEGVNFTSSGLGLSEANFSNENAVQVSLDQLLAATSAVRDFGNSIANDLSVIQTRQDFTEKTIDTLEEGSDKLTLADPNEEGAKLLSLQTRQQLSITSLSLASQSQSAVLSLF